MHESIENIGSQPILSHIRESVLGGGWDNFKGLSEREVVRTLILSREPKDSFDWRGPGEGDIFEVVSISIDEYLSSSAAGLRARHRHAVFDLIILLDQPQRDGEMQRLVQCFMKMVTDHTPIIIGFGERGSGPAMAAQESFGTMVPMYWSIHEDWSCSVLSESHEWCLLGPTAPLDWQSGPEADNVGAYTVERSSVLKAGARPLCFMTDHLWNSEVARAAESTGLVEIITVLRDGVPIFQVPHYLHRMLSSVDCLRSISAWVSTFSRWEWFSDTIENFVEGVGALREWHMAQLAWQGWTIVDSMVIDDHFIISTNMLPSAELIGAYGKTPFVYRNYAAPCILAAESNEAFLAQFDSKSRWNKSKSAKMRAPLGLHYHAPMSYEEFCGPEVQRIIKDWFDMFEEPYPPAPNPWEDFNLAIMHATIRGASPGDVLLLPVYDGTEALWGVDFLVRITGKGLWERPWFFHRPTDRKYRPGWFFHHETALIAGQYGIRAISCGAEDMDDATFEDEEALEAYYKYQQTHHRMPTLGVNTNTAYGVPEGIIEMSDLNLSLVD